MGHVAQVEGGAALLQHLARGGVASLCEIFSDAHPRGLRYQRDRTPVRYRISQLAEMCILFLRT